MSKTEILSIRHKKTGAAKQLPYMSKTQNNIEKAYQLDKSYMDGSPILYLARFWSVLPWPLKNLKKSDIYFKEYHSGGYFESSIFKYEAMIYYAEMLNDYDNKNPKIKSLLENALNSPSPYFKNWAQRLLDQRK